MAYNTIHFQHPTTGQIREALVGFSWTCFFFGFFSSVLPGRLEMGNHHAAHCSDDVRPELAHFYVHL